MKNALVISGGGCKGAFAVGAVEYLMEIGTTFDILIGTSTGALITSMVAANSFSLIKEIYRTVHTSDLLKKNCFVTLPWRKSYYRTNGLRRLIDLAMSPATYEEILSNKKTAVTCTVGLNSGATCYWAAHDMPNREAYVDCLLASCNQPGLMPPVKLHDGSYHVDGGVREIVPIQEAIEYGATHIYAINLATETIGTNTSTYSSIPEVLLRTLNIMFHETRSNDIAIVKEAIADDAGYNLTLIQPDAELSSNDLEFIPERMQAMMQTGYDKAKEVLSAEDQQQQQ